MKLFLIGELPMLFKDKSRRSHYEYNSKKYRVTFWSSGTFLLVSENHPLSGWFSRGFCR